MQDPDTLVRQYIDGDLPPNEEESALHAIARDEDARAVLRFEVQSVRTMTQRGGAAPKDFAARTMDALATHAAATKSSDRAPASTPSVLDTLRRWWDAATRPRPVRIRPTTALATVLLASLVVWSATALRTDRPASLPTTGPAASSPDPAQSNSIQATRASQTAPTSSEVVWTRFVFTDPDAQSVAVAGDFSQWEPIPLSPRTVNGQTVWTGLVPVGRGEHEYQFVIDGSRWVTDPLAPVTRDDGFGAQNAVLKL